VCLDWQEPGPRTVRAFEHHRVKSVYLATFHERCWDQYSMQRAGRGEPVHDWTLGDPPSGG
jgi:hypothetical protein